MAGASASAGANVGKVSLEVNARCGLGGLTVEHGQLRVLSAFDAVEHVERLQRDESLLEHRRGLREGVLGGLHEERPRLVFLKRGVVDQVGEALVRPVDCSNATPQRL
jgi:hypothetical protein